MAPTGHLLNAISVVTFVTLRLVTNSRAWFWERLRNVVFAFSWRDFPLPIPNQQPLGFVAGLTACRTEPLGDLGKAIDASVQQIAARDSKHLWDVLVSC